MCTMYTARRFFAEWCVKIINLLHYAEHNNVHMYDAYLAAIIFLHEQ